MWVDFCIVFFFTIVSTGNRDHFYFGVNMAWGVNAVDENRSSETEDTVSFLGLTEIMG